MTEQQSNTIDLKKIGDKLWSDRKKFYWAMPITFVVSCALILCVPKYYNCTIVLAPENGTNQIYPLGSLASNFGIDLGNINSEDAIYPNLYPNIVNSSDFCVQLFETPISTNDDTFTGSYYQYLMKKTKYPFWIWCKIYVKRGIQSIVNLFIKEEILDSQQTINPRHLNKQQWGVIETIRSNISCTIDKKTNLVIISVSAQDPMVCTQLADTVSSKLQQFMTNYRTQKIRLDITQYDQLLEDSKNAYDNACEAYISYSDAHSNVTLQAYRVRLSQLQNEMDIQQSAYLTLQKQKLAAEAKLQEQTPIYTAIQGATIPYKAAGPHRVIFVMGMCLFVFLVLFVWVIREDIIQLIL